MVDRALVDRKIERVEYHLKLIRTKKDPGAEAFSRNPDLQSIVLFNLVQAIQSCVDIGAHIISDSGWEMPGSQTGIFLTLAEHKVISKPLAGKMTGMVGFRNRIVHEYEKVDMKIVHEVWRKHLTDLEKFCKAVAAGKRAL